MSWVASLYSRRIINVNVNVVVAGAIALLVTIGVMHMFDRWGFIDHLKGIVPDFTVDLFGKHFELHGQKFVISGLTFIVDLIADVMVYYGLHWLANHMPRRAGRPKTSVAYADLSFVRDASLVQFERAILSPMLYVVALGLQNTMLHKGVSLEKATAVGFSLGILLTRLMHTLWMMRQERRAIRRLTDTGPARVPPPANPPAAAPDAAATLTPGEPKSLPNDRAQPTQAGRGS
jgi:hypothetical protein